MRSMRLVPLGKHSDGASGLFRYFRALITDQSADRMALTRVVMLDNTDTDVLSSGLTTNASSVLTTFNHDHPLNATETFAESWQPSAAPSVGTPQWWSVDLGAGNEDLPKTFEFIYSIQDKYPTDFKIQGSNDNSTWTDLVTVSGLSGLLVSTATDDKCQLPFVRHFIGTPPTAGSYCSYRLKITDNSGTTDELQVKDAGGTNRLTGGRGYCNGWYTTYTIDNAFDGSSATHCVSGLAVDATNPFYVGMDTLPTSAFVPASYVVGGDATGGASRIYRSPGDWVLQASNDNITWTDLDTQTGVTWSAQGETKTFTIT